MIVARCEGPFHLWMLKPLPLNVPESPELSNLPNHRDLPKSICGIGPRPRIARAVAAAEYFIYAMTKYAGAYAAVLGGLDAFVFTAGIGEHSVPVRAALCAKLAWLGVKLATSRRTPPADRAFPPRTAPCRSGSSPPTRS